MAVEGVPLFIGGGEAQHSAEMLRMQNFFHFRGQEGWLTANAGNCTTLATPGAGVTLAPGPFLVNSRFPGGAMQSYMGRILQATDVSTTTVPPGSGRSDFVVMNIEDPYPEDGSNWPYPGAAGSQSRKTGPYVNVRVIDNVPSNCLTLDGLDISRPERNWTAIPVARLDRPANTATITADMIKPLRSVINPWAGIQLPQEVLNNLTDLDNAVSTIGDAVEGLVNQKLPVPAARIDAYTCSAANNTNTVAPSNTQFKIWPQESQDQMIIPPWANRMRFYYEVIGAIHQTSGTVPGVDANVYCGMRVKVGRVYSSSSIQEFVEPLDVSYSNCPDKRPNRPPIFCNPKVAGEIQLDPRDIGRVVTFQSEVAMIVSSGGTVTATHNGCLIALQGITEVYLNFEFLEAGSV